MSTAEDIMDDAKMNAWHDEQHEALEVIEASCAYCQGIHERNHDGDCFNSECPFCAAWMDEQREYWFRLFQREIRAGLHPEPDEQVVTADADGFVLSWDRDVDFIRDEARGK